MVDQQSGVILGAINFTENIHDSKTVPEVLEQVQRLQGEKPKEAYVDRGYRGISQYEQTRICVPKPNKSINKKTRRKHSRRSAIEPKIGHLKSDHRLKLNFLKGILGDQMNIILAACAMNFKRVINLWRTEAIFRWLLFYKWFQEVCTNCFVFKLKMGPQGRPLSNKNF